MEARCNPLTRGFPPIPSLRPPRWGRDPSGWSSSAFPPALQLAQIRPQSRSPSGPGTRAARSHGSQPKQLLWLKAYAACPEGPSAAAPAYLLFCGQLEAQSTKHTHDKYGASPTGPHDAGLLTPHLSHLTQKLQIAVLPSGKYMKYLQNTGLTKSHGPSKILALRSGSMQSPRLA